MSQTYIDETGVVSLAKVVKHTGFVEVGETGHVFRLLELGRVDLLCDADVTLFLLWPGKRKKVDTSEKVYIVPSVSAFCLGDHFKFFFHIN